VKYFMLGLPLHLQNKMFSSIRESQPMLSLIQMKSWCATLVANTHMMAVQNTIFCFSLVESSGGDLTLGQLYEPEDLSLLSNVICVMSCIFCLLF